MKRVIALSFVSLFLLSIPGTAQESKIPRDMAKLLARAQEFWHLFESNQRLKALEYVLPEKRELLVSSTRLPFKEPRVVGIDFTDDPNRSLVRVSLQVMVQDVSVGYLPSSITDRWVWTKNNWFLDPAEAPLREMFKPVNLAPAPAGKSIDKSKEDLERSLVVTESVIDLGVIPQGERRRFPIHLGYTGEKPARLQLDFPNEAISTEGVSPSINAATKEIGLTLVSELWQDDFAFPVTLKVSTEAARVERTVLVRGSVFAPITISQNPAVFVDGVGNKVELRIHNNTDQAVTVVSISTDDAFSLNQLPAPIPAKGEASVTLVRKISDARADKVYVTFTTPPKASAMSVYSLRVKSER